MFQICFILSAAVLFAKADAKVAYAAKARAARARSLRLAQRGQLRGPADLSLLQKVLTVEEEPEQLENWVDGGLAAHSSFSTKELGEFGEHITGEIYGQQLHDIADISSSRFIASKGNVKAAEFIQSEFEDLGLKVWVEGLDLNSQDVAQFISSHGVRTGAIIGRLDGTDLADEAVMVAAHFDSVNWVNVEDEAPGIDDNGSGLALVLLLAKALAKSDVHLRKSVIFAAFNAEEEGLVGSTQVAPIVASGKYGNVTSIVIADEVAWPGSGSAKREAIFETLGTVDGTTALLDTFAHSAKEGDGVEGFKVNKHGFGSDHMPFLELGIPSVLLIEGDNMHHADVWGHSSKDTFEHVDFDFGASMSRLALNVVAKLASPEE